MVPEKYGLAAVGRYLLESFERRRPGWKEWTKEIEADLREQSERELVQMERQLRELGIGDPEYWKKVRGALDAILLPRYAAVASAEIELARRDYGIWRGGDLIARAVFALVAFVVGIVIVEIPYIPIYEKWFPAVLLVLGPLFPDIALWWYRRRYRRKLEELVADLARASEDLDRYRPISELQRSLAVAPAELEAEAEPITGDAPRPIRERGRG